MTDFFKTLMHVMVVALLTLPTRAGATEWGRDLAADRDDVPSFTVGLVSDVRLSVIEGGGSVPDGDLEINESAWAFGFSDEYWGWLCSMRVDLLFASVSEGETAHGDLYLETADAIAFNGMEYDYMWVPEGAPYENEFTGGWLELNGMLHPLMLGHEENNVTPLLEFGFMAMAGTAGLDAGEPTSAAGDFVVGGDSSGMVGSFTPQLGGGIDWRMGAADRVHHVVQLHVLVAMPGISDADHLNVKGTYRAELPLRDFENSLFAGIDLQLFETDLEDGDERAESGRTSVLLMLGMTY